MSDTLKKRDQVNTTVRKPIRDKLEEVKRLPQFSDSTDGDILKEAFLIAYPLWISGEMIDIPGGRTITKHEMLLGKKPTLEQLQEDIPDPTPLVQVELLGEVSAGQPIEESENKEIISVPKTMLKKSGDHFALRVRGDSMIDAGINSGDIIIVRSQKTAEDGDIVVAWIRDNGVLVKKFYKYPNQIVLQPMSPNHKPILEKPSNVVIKGIYVNKIQAA